MKGILNFFLVIKVCFYLAICPQLGVWFYSTPDPAAQIFSTVHRKNRVKDTTVNRVYINQLPPAPSAVSLLGGLRPTKAQHKPATVEEDAHNRISYWQDKKNTDVVAKAISVSGKLKQQQIDEKKDPVLGPILSRDYSKPDLRMFPLLKSITNSLQVLAS